MSKAFVNEDAVSDATLALPERPAVPPPITPRGVERLRAELASLEATAWRARVLTQTLASVVVTPPQLRNGAAGFGCVVVVADAAGVRRSYQIVGPDEAEPARGLVSVTSPVAQALLGRCVGDEVIVKKPRGDELLVVADVALPQDGDNV